MFTDLPQLLQACAAILNPDSNAFLLLTSYAIRASAVAFGQTVGAALPGAAVECGELFVREQDNGRLLPTSMYARAVLTRAVK